GCAPPDQPRRLLRGELRLRGAGSPPPVSHSWDRADQPRAGGHHEPRTGDRTLMAAKLSVNIDHVATLRQARRTAYPDPVEAAQIAEKAGAAGITVHLRMDRRHIQDSDVELLRGAVKGKLNLEMSSAEEMARVALA